MPAALVAWEDCRFASCSVLPVAQACDLRCRFCFSRSSISALPRQRVDWAALDVAGYYRFARERGARRLVITGGGEPLLRPDAVLHLIRVGRAFFSEITCFTNGSRLTTALARALREAGLSYLCWSRHHHDDAQNRALMGDGAPPLASVLAAARAAGLPVRATCVLARGYIADRAGAGRYMAAMAPLGVQEFTFKHTYVAYPRSRFRGSGQDSWARDHQIEQDIFEGEGRLIGTLPWGPQIREVAGCKVCYYREPTPAWEQAAGLCRSTNLMADGKVFASLEDTSSLLFQLRASQPLRASSA